MEVSFPMGADMIQVSRSQDRSVQIAARMLAIGLLIAFLAFHSLFVFSLESIAGSLDGTEITSGTSPSQVAQTPTGRPDFPATNTAPTNAGVVAASFEPSCTYLSCTFRVKNTDRANEVCRWDPGDGSPSQELPCGSPFAYEFKDAGWHSVRLTHANGESVTVPVLVEDLPGSTTSALPGSSTASVTSSPVPTGSGSVLPSTREPSPSSGSAVPTASGSSGSTNPEPTSTGSVGDETSAYLKKCLKGTIAYQPPSPMWQGEEREFVLRVALQGSPKNPSSGLPSGGPAVTEHPQLCSQMRADLTGLGFDIRRRGDTTGLMSLPSDGVGEWGWFITPRESGRRTLTLHLIAPLPRGGEYEVETYRKDIEVNVGVLYVVGVAVREWAVPLGITLPVVVGAVSALYLRSRSNRYQAKHASKTGFE
ncbi:hypothetical protein ABIE00_002866 [Arthrobacter sp. OAP107]